MVQSVRNIKREGKIQELLPRDSKIWYMIAFFNPPELKDFITSLFIEI